MLIKKEVRIQVFKNLFREGVMCAAKDYMSDKTLGEDTEGSEITVRNTEVIKLMTSLRSRGYVRETFNWQWYYWYLTNEGIEYLREYLHLPAEIVPATLKKQADRPAAGPRSFAGDREGSRFADKKREGGFKPSFRGEGGERRRFAGRSEGREDGYRREGGFGGNRQD